MEDGDSLEVLLERECLYIDDSGGSCMKWLTGTEVGGSR